MPSTNRTAPVARARWARSRRTRWTLPRVVAYGRAVHAARCAAIEALAASIAGRAA